MTMTASTVRRALPRAKCLAGAMALASALAGPAAAQSLPADSAGSDERIVVVGGSTYSQGLSADFHALRSHYRINEPIQFQVRGNRPFYLYLYSIDPARGQGVLLFPNRYQTANRFWPGYSHVLPGRSAEFSSDRVGTEHVVMVASTRPIDLPMDRFEAYGSFSRGSAADFDELLQVRPARTLGANDLVVRSLDLEIRGDSPSWFSSTPAAAPTAELPVAFVSTPEPVYHEGERMPIVYGADRDGWVHLYAVSPGGAYELLTLRQVMANQAQTLRVRALYPYGDHRLIAIYSPDAEPQDQLVTDVIDGRFAGIVPGSADAELGVAVYTVRVAGY